MALFLALIACDEMYIEPPRVTQVESDHNRPGRAYALVYSGSDYSREMEEVSVGGYMEYQPVIIRGEDVAYETDDYGQHWRRSTYVFPKTPAAPDLLTMRDETLYMGEQAIWSFPRRMFRFFFLSDSSSAPRFELPYSVSGSLQGETLYAAMGTEGVLVGRLTAQPALTDWQITSAGLDLLNPLPLVIINPLEVGGVVALGLLLPPFAVLHAFLLYCVWVYFLPPAHARTYAAMTTLALVLVAVLAIIVWLTDIRTDFYPMVAAVTIVTVLAGAGLTFSFADQTREAPRKTQLTLAAALVSLIVPAGVAAIWLGWWVVFLVVFGYGLFRWAFLRYFSTAALTSSLRQRADRLAMEAVAVGVLITIGTSVGLALSWSTFDGRPGIDSDLMHNIRLASGAVMLALITILMNRYVLYRLRNWTKSHHSDRPATLRRDIGIATLGWLVLSGAAAFGTFVGQVWAYDWFTRLLD